MFTVQCIPIARGSQAGELTYFSALSYPAGSVVEVPLRGKQVPALVVSSTTVRDAKSTIRTSDYGLRKIKRQTGRLVVTPEYIKAAENTARYYAANLGAVLFSFLPKALVDFGASVPEAPDSTRPRLRGFIVPRLYQGLASDRIDFYKSTIRESFAVGGSVYVTVPTVADAEQVSAKLQTGIGQYVHMLHGSLSKKVQQERITAILASEHPVVIVATSSYFSLPRHDLVTVVVEREGSSLYRTRTRPYVDARIFAHELAAALGGQLYLADLPLRVDSIHRRELGEYEEVVTGHHRMHFRTKAEIINMQDTATARTREFRALSRELVDRMLETGEHGGRTFLYVARRGLSPVTLCRDCGTVVVCNECGASVVLHRGDKENYFLCHSCGALRHARERCANCTSWRLEAYGIGTELVERELAHVLPSRPVHVLSSDTAKTHKKASQIVKAFYDEHGSVLVGTELALPYLEKHVPIVGVVSLDSLLSLASWNIYERIAATLTRLRDVAGEELMVQTRRPEADVLRRVLSGNFSGFYRDELRARSALGYPPYTVLVKVSVTGKQDDITMLMETAQEALKPFELVTFSRFISAPGGKFSLHGFLRVAREDWPNPELTQRLKSLSPRYTIVVDPDSIL